MTQSPIPERQRHCFENTRRQNEYGEPYWSARELAPLLEYQSWRNFVQVIEKARLACVQSGQSEADHFVEAINRVDIGSGTRRSGILDIQLSRYACYLVVQSGDPAKPAIADGQAYFAIQNRHQELADDTAFGQLSEDEKRLAIRNALAQHDKHPAATAAGAGVEGGQDFAIFQDHGYRGLYGGLGVKAIHAKKGLKKNQNMGSTELAATLFRATQIGEKLRRDSVRGKKRANAPHFAVGRKVRETIRELGGTMPEERPAPAPEHGSQQIEHKRQRMTKKDSN